MTTPTSTSTVPPDVRRLRLDLAYDGTDFTGWAVQPGYRTVQGELELWLPRVLRLTEPVVVTCAGRTDAGVHARHQVAHVDLPADTDPTHLRRRLRRALPADVSVLDVAVAPDGFHARFSALWRRYVYRLADGVPDPLHRRFVAPVKHPVDVDALNTAGATLLGLRDFAPFCRYKDGATTIRTLTDVEARRVDDLLGERVEVTLRADAFCHSMVRSLVGALTAVATGQRDLDWLARVAASPRRHHQVHVMAACGLTLEEVRYPPDDELAARAEASRRMRASSELGPQVDGEEDEE